MKRLWNLILEEPYRVFFPLGLLAGVWGVMMWPMLYGGMLGFYPGEAHNRMMMEGFIGAFAIGFLGTAFPRLSGSRSWFRGEFFALLLLWALCVFSHANGRVPAGDSAFSGLLVVLILGLAGRWITSRKDTPPPGFILAFAGLAGAAVSTWMLSRPGLGPLQTQWARIWLFQGYLLLPLMGIGPYLLPRFFGMPSRHSFDDSPTPPPGWWPRAIASATAGALIVASFAIEIHASPRIGQLLRAAVILGWFAIETPVFRRGKISSTTGNAVRWALSGLAAGCVCAALWPLQRIGSLHLFFAAGLGLITITVGTRVVLGHGGRHDLLAGKIAWLRWVLGLLVLAATTRMSAEFLPKVRVSHLNYASWCWAAGSLVWLAAVAKYLTRDDETPAKPSKCPRRKSRR